MIESQLLDTSSNYVVGLLAGEARSKLLLRSPTPKLNRLLASAAQEAIWLQQLLGDSDNKGAEPMMIYEDKQSAICMTKNALFHGRAKNIGMKYHFICKQVDKGKVTLEFFPSKDMIANMPSKDNFYKLRDMTGVKRRY